MGGKASSEATSAASPPQAAPASGGARQTVKLNVYSPTGSQHMMYHTGVEVLGAEYVFGGGDTGYSGVTAQRPRVPPPGSGWVFYQTVDIAALQVGQQDAHRIIAELRGEFPGNSYDLVTRNCNTFSDELCRRLCGQGIPSWVNRLAGLANQTGLASAVRSAAGVPAAPSAASAGSKAEGGAGGPAAAGLVTAVAAADGDLVGQVDWSGVGVLNASGQDPTGALRSGSAVTSEEGPELLLLVPFQSPVKLQAVRLEAASAAAAPRRVRLFANQPNLDMDDASGGAAATQEASDLAWTKASPGSETVSASIEVNFLKFQNLGFLCVYLAAEDVEENADGQLCLQRVRFIGKC